jgi:hypothetical protein
MKDFSVVCYDVKLDKFTQDPRIIKMKIWLHFRQMLKPYIKDVLEIKTKETFSNYHEIVDVEIV